MLTLNDEPFTQGKARYYDNDPDRVRPHSAIYIQVELPLDPAVTVLALVDTGSPYCMFDREIVEALGLSFDDGEKIKLKTKDMLVIGRLDRLDVTLAADEGTSQTIEATVFVSEDWHFGAFIGYGGLLERIRFGIDPQTNSFYFGPSE
jgi:predicted aspartyl protease